MLSHSKKWHSHFFDSLKEQGHPCSSCFFVFRRRIISCRQAVASDSPPIRSMRPSFTASSP